MAKCGRCGAETELYELDIPICPECISEREGIDRPLASLNAELTSARELYRTAMEELEHHQILCRNLPQEYSDRAAGARLQEKANRTGEKYWDLLRAYSEALRRNSE
jgi:hypothetical protein